ncbi:hypothetical protein ABDK00_017570 [Niabella insulamsoli]|uniref:hypothetical protein n=1 Tax=Niabella insulamsoli TaxID=3144874 RepID=UPI0031FDB77E
MKPSMLFLLLAIITNPMWAQNSCPQVHTLDGGVTILYAQDPANFRAGDVILKSNAININGVSYDALFTIIGKRLGGGGNAALAQTNGESHFRLGGTHAENNPYIRYNLKFVTSGSATSGNLGGQPVTLNNLKMYLPDVDGEEDASRWYVDIVGYRVTGGTPPTVTSGSGLSQQGFYANTSTAAMQAISETANYTKYRPNVSTNDYSDNFLTTKTASNPSATTYALDFSFAQFPKTGIDLLFGVTSDPAQAVSSVTQGSASRTFFHVFTVANCTGGTTLPATFDQIDAFTKNNQLVVHWKTLNESNNEKFLIEVSTDGQNFQKISEVQSKAAAGVSSGALSYSFATPWNAIAGIALIPLLLLGFSRSARQKNAVVLALIALSMTAVLYGCSKTGASVAALQDKKIFIRIGQVDKDGTVRYSKTVQVSQNE